MVRLVSADDADRRSVSHDYISDLAPILSGDFDHRRTMCLCEWKGCREEENSLIWVGRTMCKCLTVARGKQTGGKEV